MTKEEAYDTQISPLMAQIIAICKEHKIAHVCSFSLDFESGLCCTTFDIEDEQKPPDEFVRMVAIIHPPRTRELIIRQALKK